MLGGRLPDRLDPLRVVDERVAVVLVGVVDDLVAALENGEIAGCGLDVFEVEPLPTDHKLWTLPNVLLTPHIAVKDADNVPERQYALLLENARRFAAGEPLRNVVDKRTWY